MRRFNLLAMSSGWRRPTPGRVWRALVRRTNYVWGPRLTSWLRRRWVIFKNPHAEIRFGPYCRLRRGFNLDMAEGGRFITGAAVDFRDGFRAEIAAGGSVIIGEGCVFSYYSLIQCSTSIEIGDRAMFGQSSIIVDGNHRFKDVSKPLVKQGFDFRPVKIADDVTTLTKCTLLADIGTKATVAANSVVSKPVPAYSLVGGVPARLIDYFGPPELAPPEWRARQRDKGVPEPPERAGTLEVSGHSLAFGGGVSAFDRRYTTRLAEMLDATEVNHSVAGAIACWPETGSNPGDGGYQRVLERVQRPSDPLAEHPAGFTALTHFGVNDLAVLGPSRLKPFEHALRTVISRHRAVAVFGPDHESVSELDGSVTINLPAESPGGIVALGFSVAPGAVGQISIQPDGDETSGVKLTDSADPVTRKANGIVSRHPLAGGSQTIAIRFPLDCVEFAYWQLEVGPGPAVLVPLAHRPLDWSRYSGWPHPPADSDIEPLNSAIRKVVEEFGPRVATLDIEAVLSGQPDVFSWEGAYPNDEGHLRVAEAARSVLANLPATETATGSAHPAWKN